MSSSDSLKELCVICQTQPYDLICTCGDKFDFTCIHVHVEQLGIEFEFIQNEVGQRLLSFEQIIDSTDLKHAQTIVENWKQKRIQDINNIADLALTKISQHPQTYSEIEPLRTEFFSLCERSQRVVHEQLDSLIKIQRRILDKSEELQNFSKLIPNELDLDRELISKLNPSVFQSNSIPLNEPTIEETSHIESPQLANLSEITQTKTDKQSTDMIPDDDDEFEAGQTTNIQRRNVISLPANNDRSLATICSYKTQLLYNDNDPNNQNPRLTFLSDFNQFHHKQFIHLSTNENNDSWIQDIVYSTKLQGYFILNHKNLQILSSNALQLNNFCEFSNRNMKRMTCSEKFLYFIAANNLTNQHGDEIVLFNYDKQEIICKTFIDIFISRRNHNLSGEISDIAVNNSEQIMLAYRLERREEVGIFIYTISSDGQQWTSNKQLILNECWRTDLSYTPRIEWCEKFHVFALIEYVTGHLIMIDETGQVKGETRFLNVQNRVDSPLNLSFSNEDYLCVRYATSINIHRLNNDQV